MNRRDRSGPRKPSASRACRGRPGRRRSDVPGPDEHLRVARRGPGRPRSRPDRVRGDKAYSSRAIRQHLRTRGIVAVIPEPSNQQGQRRRRGNTGGRPVGYDAEDYKGRNVVERSFNNDKQWRELATRYDKLALTYRGGAVPRSITL